MNPKTPPCLAIALTLVLAACGAREPAQPAAGPDPAPEPAAPVELEGTVYGDGVTVAETVKVSEVFARAEELEGKRVRVEGPVVGVCQKRGCWFRVAGDEEYQTLQFKVVDGVMVFPMSMKGKYAVAEGVVKRMPLTLEQTRNVLAHQAEERGEDFDPATVTEPTTVVRLDGTGAVVRDRP